VAIGLVVTLIVVYVVGALVFSVRFVPGTRLNGMDVSLMDEPTVAKAVEEEAATYKNHVSGDGFDLVVTASDVGLAVDADAVAREARGMVSGWAWPRDLVAGPDLAVSTPYTHDEESLSQKVGEAVDAFNQSASQPQNAYVYRDEESGTYVVSSQAEGTAINRAAMVEAVSVSVESLSETTEVSDAVLSKPEVSSDDEGLRACAESANQMVEHDIAFTHDGSEVGRLTSETLGEWVSVEDGDEAVLDTDASWEWIYDSFWDEMESEDDDNFYGLDTNAANELLIARLSSDSNDPVELPTTIVEEKPAQTEGASDLGRHVDVNLSTQYARFYDSDGSVIWESYIVSGNVNEGHGTPTGTYTLNAKQTDQNLVGLDEDGDGQSDYTSHVDYWMPFVGNSVGLHDADWRASFGGEIYTYYGSHGCVNLPPDKAAELFSLIEVGDTVITHY